MHRLYFENGYIVEIRNAELLRVANRNTECIEQFAWSVTLDRYRDNWVLIFDVPKLSGEPYMKSDIRPCYVRWYVGKEKLERVKDYPFKTQDKRYWQMHRAEFEVTYENPVVLVIE